MATYEFTALTVTQSIVRGTHNALTKHLAARSLRRQTLTVVTISRLHQPFSLRRWLFRGVSSMDRILFTRSLVAMFRAGLTLTESLDSLKEQTTHPVLRRMISDVQARIHQGQTLSSSLDRYPQVFSSEYRAMIAIGERSGKLLEVLTFLTEKLESDYRLARKLRTAFAYPTILVVAMIGVVSIMMLFVIPRVAAVYREADVRLPIFTRALVALSNFFALNYQWIGAAAVSIVLGFIISLKYWKRFRQVVDAAILRIPVFGETVKKANLTTISRSLSMLLRAGLPIDQSLVLTSKTASNVTYQRALRRAEPFVQRGVHLADIFKGQPELFRPVFYRMVVAGEKSGSLDSMFSNVARYYDEDLQAWSENISSVLEPILIVSVGLVVGSIAMAILYPLWNFANIIS